MLTPCRYCGDPLEHEVNCDRNPFSDLCAVNDTCMEKVQFACQKILNCGHRCPGLKGEKQHPLCLHRACREKAISTKKKSIYNQECSFCSEDLDRGPIIKSVCNHAFHYQCLLIAMERRWHTRRITFGFLSCPECKRGINISPGSKAYTLMLNHYAL